jgi:hypothetical protein
VTAPYSHEGHFRWGFNGGAYNAPSDEWRQTYDIATGVSREIEPNFRDECIRAATLIAGSTDLPIVVCLSGGFDSEVTLRSFVEAGVHIQAVTVRYNGLNDFEVDIAKAVAQNYDVPHRIIDLDILDLWRTKLDDFSQRFRSVTPHFCMHVWLIDQLRGSFPVIGGGDIYVNHRRIMSEPSSRWHATFYPKSTMTTRFMMEEELPGVPLFFIYTPELMLSYLDNTYVRQFFRTGQAIGMDSVEAFKPYFYDKFFPTQIIRKPMTGFENLFHEDFRVQRPKMEATNFRQNPECMIPLDDLLNHLRGSNIQKFPARHNPFRFLTKLQ